MLYTISLIYADTHTHPDNKNIKSVRLTLENISQKSPTTHLFNKNQMLYRKPTSICVKPVSILYDLRSKEIILLN